MTRRKLLELMPPLRSGRDTEIDMIEREMEGGVVIIQPLEVHAHYAHEPVGGLVGVREDVDVGELEITPGEEPRD